MNPEMPRSTPHPEAIVTDITKFAAERVLGVISAPPGILSGETLARIEASKHALRYGEVVTIAPEDFKGDTSKVSGHPNNLSTPILEGIGKALNEPRTTNS